MKKQWKLFCTILFMVVIACGLSISASAALTVAGGTEDVDYEYTYKDENMITILKAGTYTISGTGSSIAVSSNIDDGSATLILKNVELTAEYSCIYTGNTLDDITIQLEGTNTINNIEESSSPAIECGETPVTIQGDGTLSITSVEAGIACYASGGSLTINNVGGLSIEAEDTGILVRDGDLKLTSSGAVSIKSGGSAIDVEAGSATISATSVELTSTDGSGITAEKAISVTTTSGDVTVNADSYGITANKGAITVNAKGSLDVEAARDGIACKDYAMSLTADKDISVVSKEDDGIFTRNNLDVSCGGKFTVNAEEIAVSSDDVTLKVDGDISITSKIKYGIEASGNALAISGRSDNSKAGNITIDSVDDGISVTSCNISATSLDVTAGADGIYSVNGMTITTTENLSVKATSSAGSEFAAIRDSASINLTVGGNTTLSATGSLGYGIRIPSNAVTINGTGTVNVTSADNYAIFAATINLKGSGITLGGAENTILESSDIDFNNSPVTIDHGILEANGGISGKDNIQKGILKCSGSLDVYGAVSLDKDIGGTGTTTIHLGANLTMGSEGHIDTVNIANNGTLTIYDANSLRSEPWCSGSGSYYITTSSLSADDITVPTNLAYTGKVLNTSAIDIDLSNSTVTINEKVFQVVGASSDDSQWSYTIRKNDQEVSQVVEAGTYTVRYTNGTTTLNKNFTVGKGNPTVTMFVLNEDMTAVVEEITFGDKVNLVAVVGGEAMDDASALAMVAGKTPSAGDDNTNQMDDNYMEFQYDDSDFINQYVALTDNGDGFSYAIKAYDTTDRMLKIASGETSGVYNITANHRGGNNWYDGGAVTEHTLTMGQKTLGFAAADTLENTYNNLVYTVDLATVNQTMTLNGLENKAQAVAVSATLTTNGVNAGEYSLAKENLIISNLTLTGNDAPYYKVEKTSCTAETMDIMPVALLDDMVVLDASFIYCGKEIEPAIQVDTGKTLLVAETDYTTTYKNNINVGTATVTIKGVGNYTGTIAKNFAITKRGLFIEGIKVPSKVYDGTEDIQSYEIVWKDIQGEDVITYTGSVHWLETQAGTDKIKYSFGLTGTSANNYILHQGTVYGIPNYDGTTITKRPITITAENQVIPYGSEISTLTSDASGDNLASGHTISGVTLVQNSIHVVPSSGEDLTITPSAVTILDGESGNTTENYDITYADGTLDITPKALTITTLPQEVIYGNTVATTVDKVTTTGLITGEILDSIVLTESDKNVATFNKKVNATNPAIKNGDTVIANTNYDITYRNTGSLTITKKPIVASWSNTSTAYDGTPKKPSVAFAGMVVGDDMEETVPTKTNAGTYTVELTYGNSNYTISNPSTTFTIEKAPVTFTVTNNVVEHTGSVITPTVTNDKGVSATITYSVENPTNVGTYGIYAEINDTNYRHGTTADGAPVQIGTLTIYTTPPASYDVTFRDGTSPMEGVAGTIHILPVGLDKGNDLFAGWRYENVTYQGGETFVQPAKAVTLEAVYQAAHEIAGYVYPYNTTEGVEGVVVTLMQGSKQVAQATTDTDGSYSFGYVGEGVYNVVVAYDGITKTEKADISSADATVTITLPQYKTNAVVEVFPGTPAVIVGGLDTIAAQEIGDDTTAVVEVKLSVVQTSMTNADIEEKASNVAFYLDINVSKTVDNTEEAGYNTTPGLVEIILPIPAQFQGKDSYTVFREHESEITEITTTPNATTSEYLTVDGNAIHIFANHFSTYALAYTEHSPGSAVSSYTSSVVSTIHGDVTISADRNKMNSIVTIVPTPDQGYEVGDVTVTYASGREVTVSQNADGTYSYKQPGANVTVKVTFVEIDGESTSAFTDVSKDAYYYEAVKWAVEHGITNGTTETTFSPDATCTRAQAVTFLWKAYGSPVVERANPFTDVTEGTYYYEAVLWAVENGITNGTTATTFSPNADCTRSQIVTFLWNAEKKPVVNYLMTFQDVEGDTWYTEAVRWAVSQGITAGTSATTFNPMSDCTRGQIVTFLCRNMTNQ